MRRSPVNPRPPWALLLVALSACAGAVASSATRDAGGSDAPAEVLDGAVETRVDAGPGACVQTTCEPALAGCLPSVAPGYEQGCRACIEANCGADLSSCEQTCCPACPSEECPGEGTANLAICGADACAGACPGCVPDPEAGCAGAVAGWSCGPGDLPGYGFPLPPAFHPPDASSIAYACTSAPGPDAGPTVCCFPWDTDASAIVEGSSSCFPGNNAGIIEGQPGPGCPPMTYYFFCPADAGGPSAIRASLQCFVGDGGYTPPGTAYYCCTPQ
jgi:hypothetical protein